MGWLVFLLWAGLLIPLLVHAGPTVVHAMTPPDDPAWTAVLSGVWDFVRWLLLAMVSLLGYIFNQHRKEIDERMTNLEKHVEQIREEATARNEVVVGRLELRMKNLEDRSELRHGDNTRRLEEGNRRLERIENKMDRMIESVPSIISAAQRDLYKRIGKLEEDSES